ncbi:MAG: carbohydrate ABC transporter permease [Chthonomonas sp.]|nr:carbohydrate ABC transporter permease [Chthonomonas sp.]
MTFRSLGSLLARLAVIALFVSPIYWIFVSAMRKPGLPPPRTVEWLPAEWSLDNFARVFELIPMATYLQNSLLVGAVAVPLTLLVGSISGYSIARLSPALRGRIVVLLIVAQLLPLIALWLPRFFLVKHLGLLDTLTSLVLPVAVGSLPLYVLLFYRSCLSVPAEVYEAAELDGAPPLMAWQQMAMPLIRPTTLAVTAFSFLFYWGDFVWPLLFLKSPDNYTVSVGILQLQQLDKSNWPLLMSASLILVLPSVLVFLLVQRSFLRGNLLSGSSGW